MSQQMAIRSYRPTAPSHLWTNTRLGPWYDTACGRTLSAPQIVPWEQTAPEDRCTRCAARVDGGAS